MIDRAHAAAFVPAYTVTARVLHWIIAAMVLVMVPLGIVITNEWGGPVQQPLYNLHKSIGAVLLPLVVVRLIWRLSHPPLPLPADIPAAQQVGGTHRPLDALCAAAGPTPAGLDRDLGLSGAGAGLRTVRAAAHLGREPRPFRAAVRRPPLGRHRARRDRPGTYRCCAPAPFPAQGSRPHAHDRRRMSVRESLRVRR